MKTYKITISGKDIEITQNEDRTFNKPDMVKELEPIGTALKPAFEPICMAMKPLSEKNYVANVLKHGTGGINIDESRVECNWQKERGETWLNSGTNKEDYKGRKAQTPNEHKNTCADRVSNLGRFPANLILSWRENEYIMKEGITNEQKEKVCTWLQKNL